MPTYGAFDDFVTGLSAASALDGTEPLVVVQSGASVSATVREIQGGDGVANTVTVTGDYQFTEGNELDYSASFTDGMSAATITFTELPADTVEIRVYIYLAETGTFPYLQFERSSGGSTDFVIGASFADVGINRCAGIYTLPTSANSIRVEAVQADTTRVFKIVGYKTGS